MDVSYCLRLLSSAIAIKYHNVVGCGYLIVLLLLSSTKSLLFAATYICIFRMKSNLTVSFPSTNRLNLDALVKFPPPNDESYLVLGKFDGGRNMNEIKYLVSYRTLNSGHKYGSTGNVSRFRESVKT